ncbi:MAG: hypothetical protein ACLPKB_32030 [Xanthobacteraceae bacterium]
MLSARSGAKFGAADDLDLAWTAIDLGFGTGRFRELQAVHLIPSQRLTEEYLVRLYAGFSYSNAILWRARGLDKAGPNKDWRDTLRFFIAFFKLRGVRRRIYFASRKATRAAWRRLQEEDARVNAS